ncbi:RICIN domain-containing protein [Streptomyces sp. NPDC054787]
MRTDYGTVTSCSPPKARASEAELQQLAAKGLQDACFRDRGARADGLLGGSPAELEGTPTRRWISAAGAMAVWLRSGTTGAALTRTSPTMTTTSFVSSGITVLMGEREPGTRVTSRACSGAESQKWVAGTTIPTSTPSIFHVPSGICLDVSGWGAANGTSVVLSGTATPQIIRNGERPDN